MNVFSLLLVFLSVCPQVFGLFLWIVCWTDLFYTFHELRQGHTPPPIYFVTPLVLGMTMVSMSIQKQLHKNLNLEKKPFFGRLHSQMCHQKLL